MHVNASAISVFDGEADEAFLAATQWQTPWLPTALVDIVCAYIPHDDFVVEGAWPVVTCLMGAVQWKCTVCGKRNGASQSQCMVCKIEHEDPRTRPQKARNTLTVFEV